jgi:hypothetical protein
MVIGELELDEVKDTIYYMRLSREVRYEVLRRYTRVSLVGAAN